MMAGVLLPLWLATVLAAPTADDPVRVSDSASTEPETTEPAATEPAPTEPTQCQAPFPLAAKHSTLQRNLEKRLAQAGWSKHLAKKVLAVATVDMSRRGRIYYAGVNDNEMMYSASMPKIAILLTVIEAVEAGRLTWTHEFDKRLQNMIVESSNADASWGVDQVGLEAISKVVQDPRYCFYDAKHGGLWVGRAYRGGGPTNRDPIKDLSHAATARQAARFFVLLDAGLLVSPHWSFRILGLMSPPRHFHKFVGGLKDRTGVVFMARKSGTWRNYHSDSALIQHLGARYVLVGVSETRDGERIMRELAQIVDDLMVKGQHRKRARPSRRHARQ